jgi:hypothetical protein
MTCVHPLLTKTFAVPLPCDACLQMDDAIASADQ